MTNDTLTRRRRTGGGSGIVFPLILIAAGLLFLLDNLGAVNVDWWALLRLWPLLLILGGLDLLLGGRSLVGNLIVAVAGVAILGGVIYVIAVDGVDELGLAGNAQEYSAREYSGQTITIDEPLDGAELAELDVRLAGGDLTIGALDDSDMLIEGVLRVEREKPTWQVVRDGSTVRLTIDQTGDEEGSFDLDAGDDWHLLLSPHAGTSLDVDLGAGSAELDLADLDLRDLVVNAGAGSIEVTFPARGDYTARVSGGVGDVELIIPRGVAVRLQIDRGLTTLDLPARYERQGDNYITEDWDGAEDRVELFVNVGVGLLTIRDG
ncbi:MAG: hypothetical protein JXA93_04395 [Anaerolineae bacterium]|nr:hypothetical protein [Anaerolineae bacterium]